MLLNPFLINGTSQLYYLIRKNNRICIEQNIKNLMRKNLYSYLLAQSKKKNKL